jgi:hypothetical protein
MWQRKVILLPKDTDVLEQYGAVPPVTKAWKAVEGEVTDSHRPQGYLGCLPTGLKCPKGALCPSTPSSAC